MEITATQPVRGVNIPIRSIVARKPAPAAVYRPMIMQTIAILMAHGQKRTIRSTSARKPAPLAAIPVMSMPTIPTRMVMANVTPAAQPFR